MDKALIDFNNDFLTISFGDNKEYSIACKRFLEFLLKFTYFDIRNEFSLKIKDNDFEVLREVLKFLSQKRIRFEATKSIKEIMYQLEEGDDEFKQRIHSAMKIKRDRFKEININGFLRTLKPYQHKSFKHLIQIRNGANFSVPGSGKTTVALAYFDYLKMNNIVEKLLVVGPRSSFVPWEDEYKLCFGHNPNLQRISGDKNRRLKIYNQIEDREIFLTTYQTASNDIDYLIDICKRFKFLLILDEAHYIKRLFNGFWSSQLLKLSKYAIAKLILTGTPAPNTYEDLWNQVSFLWPNRKILGDKNKFKNKGFNEVKTSINPFYTRTSKKELGLPVPKFERIVIELAPLQKRIYESLAIKFLSELREPPQIRSELRAWRKAKIVYQIEAATNPALLKSYSDEFRVPPLDSSYSSLIQIIENYTDFEVPPKFPYLINEIKKIISEGKKVVVWTSFINNIKILSKILDKEKILFSRVYGEIPKDFSENEEDNREKEIERFKTDKQTSILLANPAACSESISLHKVCKVAYYLDRTFNGGQYMQSLDRIHRLGLTKEDKIVYKLLISKDTIDEVIDKRLEEKIQAMESLLAEEITVGSLDESPLDVNGVESEEEKDFNATVAFMKQKYK